ncbi:MAG: hypothetical protein HYU29_08455 [Chloroflexi bacterium]|nr:hypothetical protein [Chloroflexota bacterium]
MNAYVMVLAWEPANEAISEAVASMWEQNLGLRVKRQLTEYRPTVRQKLVERATAGYTYIFSNPGVSDPVNYGCACCIGPSWVTVLHTEHPKVDELCGPLLKELDTNKWVPGLQKLGDFLYYNYWNAPIANGNALFAAGKRVKSYTPWPQSSLMQVIEYVTLNR